MTDQIIEIKKCTISWQEFSITQWDVDFYNKISPIFAGQKFTIPTPTLCPEERQRRRLAFRNERNLYRRTCDASGKQIISIYSPDKPYKVYDQKVWWSDSRDAMDYGRDFDFTKTFTENFRELVLHVPRFSLQNWNNRTNADYTNWWDYEENCYMVFNACYLQDCLYGTKVYRSKDCIDMYGCFDSELCYECTDIYNCFNCFYSINLKDCSYCYWSNNCIWCKFCINCSNLSNSEYYYNNEYVGKEKYQELLIQYSNTYFSSKIIIDNENCDNCIGNYLKNCKEVYYSNEIENGENLKYCCKLNNAQNCYDYDVWWDKAEWFYECQSAGWWWYHNMFVNVTRQWSENLYCDNCVENCSHCFWCVGLRNKSYCIFNKQYTKEEYEKTVANIIAHMIETGERWEFFHPSLSPFGYNETVAQEYYPVHLVGTQFFASDTKTDKNLSLQEFGYHRSHYESPKPVSDKVIPGKDLPDTIGVVEDSILDYAIACEVTGKLFRIQSQELVFYRNHGIPLPRKHPDQRHLERLALRK